MVSPSKSASQDDSSERRSHSRFRGLISCFVSCQHLADPFVLMPCQRLSKSVSDESIPSGPVPEFLHQGRRVVHQTQVLSDILGLAEAGLHLQSSALVLQDNRTSSCQVSNPGFVRSSSIASIASLEQCIPSFPSHCCSRIQPPSQIIYFLQKSTLKPSIRAIKAS